MARCTRRAPRLELRARHRPSHGGHLARALLASSACVQTLGHRDQLHAYRRPRRRNQQGRCRRRLLCARRARVHRECAPGRASGRAASAESLHTGHCKPPAPRGDGARARRPIPHDLVRRPELPRRPRSGGGPPSHPERPVAPAARARPAQAGDGRPPRPLWLLGGASSLPAHVQVRTSHRRADAPPNPPAAARLCHLRQQAGERRRGGCLTLRAEPLDAREGRAP